MVVELPEDCRGRWVTFVDQTLSETNRKNTIDLVNMHVFLFKLCNSIRTKSNFKCGISGVFFFPVQIGTGHPRPSSEDDMESPFPKELTLQQVHQHPCQKILKTTVIRDSREINLIQLCVLGFLRLPDPADDR